MEIILGCSWFEFLKQHLLNMSVQEIAAIEAVKPITYSTVPGYPSGFV